MYTTKDVDIDMKMIERPYLKIANKQPWSCFAETPKVDFAKGTNRDDVSFYKKLARFEKASKLDIPVDDLEVAIHRARKIGMPVEEYIKLQKKKEEKDEKRSSVSIKKKPAQMVTNPSSHMSEKSKSPI